MLPDRDTVAYAEVDGKPVLGVNSTAPGYTEADRAAANQMRATLLVKYPDAMATDNIGQIPNNALYHAEATLLLRAAAANRGSLAGRTIDMLVDNTMCPSCQEILPLIGRALGNPTVRFADPAGRRRTMRDGNLVSE
jgi:hypothetical protein